MRSWATPVPLPGKQVRSIAIAGSADDTAMVGWSAPLTDGQVAYGDGWVATSTGWDNPQSLETRGDNGYSDTTGLTIAMDPYGSALAVWITQMTYVVSQTANST